MDRDEHVGLLVAGPLDANAMRQEVISLTRQNGAHARFPVDSVLEPPRNCQRDILFARARSAQGAGIVAAMTGVDCHNDVATAGRGRSLHNNWRRVDGRSFRRAHDCSVARHEIQNQPMAEIALRLNREHSRSRRRGQVNYQTQIRALCTCTQLFGESLTRRHRDLPFSNRADVMSTTTRSGFRSVSDCVVGGAGQIEDNAGRIRTGPETYIPDHYSRSGER